MEKSDKRTSSRSIKVGSEDAGKRLDIAATILFGDLSRSEVKKQIDTNNVSVNGKVEYRANYKVCEGDEITINLEEKEGDERLVPEDIPLDVIYEDDDLIAINKPIGMVVHPANGNWTGTVMNAILYRYKEIGMIGGNFRSGLIHRLDKDTSGVLLISKTSRGLWHYTKMFSERKVEKQYIACTSGRLHSDLEREGRMEFRSYVSRHVGDRKKMMVTSLDNSYTDDLPAGSRLAVTDIRLIDSNSEYHLYSVFPKTGRTHQIRVHCKYLGTPIIGDVVYGGKMGNRLMLHAFRIKIRNLEGKPLSIVANPDSNFLGNIEKYGLNASAIKN